MNSFAANLRSRHFTSFSLHVLIYGVETHNDQLGADITCTGTLHGVLNKYPLPFYFSWFCRPLLSSSFHLSLLSVSDSPSPLLNSVNVASSDLSHNLPQSHLPPKLAKRLMREAGTLRSREWALSWKIRRRSEGGTVGTVPRNPNNLPPHYPPSSGASCRNGALLVRWKAMIPGAEGSSWAGPPGPCKCPPHSGRGQTHPDEAFGTQNSYVVPARDVDIGEKWKTWGLPGPLNSSLSLYLLTIPSGSSAWRPLPSILPTSGAQTPGPHKADQQSGPAVHRSPAVGPPLPASSPGREEEGLLGPQFWG